MFWLKFYTVDWVKRFFAKKGPPGDEGAESWEPPLTNPEQVVLYDGLTLDGDFRIRKSGAVVRNCVINGSLRVMGEAHNGEHPSLTESSRTAEHVKRLRAKTPSHVLIENCVINADGMTPIYVAPGCTYVTIRNCVIRGYARSVMVYLDTESSRNTIEGCFINARFCAREAVAIDSSDHNIVRGNVIVLSNTGGIFLYRNSGEGGNIRHTTPSYNVIEENEFRRRGVSVFLDSRGGGKKYGKLDEGYPYGSSQSDLDHSRYNNVVNNILNGTNIKEMSGHSNVIKGNKK